MDFSWESMAGNLQDNAFNEKKTYTNEVDTRFWKLARDEQGNGGAIIRFLPDANNVPFVSLTQIRAKQKNGKGFFVTEWSPDSIGLKCPFNEKFSELWNAGQKDTAKTLGKSQRFITNIQVITDPANPENEGKFFLYEMSQTMMNSIKGVMVQTPAMKALDEDPVAVFNPVQGNNFLVKVKDGDNGIPTYADSKFAGKITGIFADKEAAEAAIAANTHSLKEFLDPTNFLSYEELTDKLHRFLKIEKYAEGADATATATEAATEPVIDTGLDATATQATETTPVETAVETIETPATETASAEPDADAELDDLLAELG